MIITFYSYKGGVGRTQLVANIAAYLCYDKKQRVLLIDWDLEAPGLHFYFKKDTVSNDGLIELFSEYVKKARSSNDVRQILPDLSEIKSNIVNIESTNNSSIGVIDLITAGNYQIEYSNKINSFDWFNFYDGLEGNIFIEYLKDKLVELNYDFILIDSRTGISDYSGICNIQMPDANVIITVPNKQNFEGTKRIIKAIENSPYVKSGYREPIVFPVLSRLDTSVEKESVRWQKKFIKEFRKTILRLSDFVDIDLEDGYVKDTLLEYKRDLAFEETVLFSVHNKLERDHKTLAEPYGNLGELITFLKTRINKNRKPSSTSENKKFFIRIENLIQESRVEKALDEMMGYAKLIDNVDLVDDILSVTARLKKLTRSVRIGTISKDDSNVETNRIIYSSIRILDELKLHEKSKENIPLDSHEIQSLKELDELLRKKLLFLQKEIILTFDPSTKFALSHEIKDLKKQIDETNIKLKRTR